MRIQYLDNDGKPCEVDAPADVLLKIIREFRQEFAPLVPEKISVKQFLLSLDWHMDFRLPCGFQLHPDQQEMFDLAELEARLKAEVKQSKPHSPRPLAA